MIAAVHGTYGRFCSCWTWAASLVFLWLVQCPPLWARKRRLPTVIVQAVWVFLTWAVWVAGVSTMNRGLPLLNLKAKCAGADYCTQLQFTCGERACRAYAISTHARRTREALALLQMCVEIALRHGPHADVLDRATFSLGLFKMLWAVRETRKGTTEWY